MNEFRVVKITECKDNRIYLVVSTTGRYSKYHGCFLNPHPSNKDIVVGGIETIPSEFLVALSN